jgi:hypothetical protein
VFFSFQALSQTGGEGAKNSGAPRRARLDDLSQLPHNAASAGAMRRERFALRKRDLPLGMGRCTGTSRCVPDILVLSGHRCLLAGCESITNARTTCNIHGIYSKWKVGFYLGRTRPEGRLTLSTTLEQLTFRSAGCYKSHADPQSSFPRFWFFVGRRGAGANRPPAFYF